MHERVGTDIHRPVQTHEIRRDVAHLRNLAVGYGDIKGRHFPSKVGDVYRLRDGRGVRAGNGRIKAGSGQIGDGDVPRGLSVGGLERQRSAQPVKCRFVAAVCRLARLLEADFRRNHRNREAAGQVIRSLAVGGGQRQLILRCVGGKARNGQSLVARLDGEGCAVIARELQPERNGIHGFTLEVQVLLRRLHARHNRNVQGRGLSLIGNGQSLLAQLVLVIAGDLHVLVSQVYLLPVHGQFAAGQVQLIALHEQDLRHIVLADKHGAVAGGPGAGPVAGSRSIAGNRQEQKPRKEE